MPLTNSSGVYSNVTCVDGLQGMNGLDTFAGAFPGCGAADLQMVLQQQAAILNQQPNLMTPGTPLPHQAQAAAMAQTAALMANMGQDPTAAAAGLSAYSPMLGGVLSDASAGVGNMQMQMLMYYAQLGMMAQMNGGGNNMGMGIQAAGGMPNMANPMMFPMMTPQQMAASFAAAQQQWQAGMPASAIANIAAAAAVAATAASNPEVSYVQSSRSAAAGKCLTCDVAYNHRALLSMQGSPCSLRVCVRESLCHSLVCALLPVGVSCLRHALLHAFPHPEPVSLHNRRAGYCSTGSWPWQSPLQQAPWCSHGQRPTAPPALRQRWSWQFRPSG